MTTGEDITDAARKALEAFHRHAQTQHELFKTIPMTPKAVGRGMIEFEVTVPDLFSDGETVHGGLFTILLDTILATAAWSRMETFQPLATINLKTDFFSDAKPDEVMLFRATCQSIKDDVAFCQGTAFAADQAPVAQADGTFMVGTTSPAVKGSRL